MYWSIEDQRWELVNVRKSSLIAFLPSVVKELPMGTTQWMFVQNESCSGKLSTSKFTHPFLIKNIDTYTINIDNQSEYRKLNLHLNVGNSGKFCCDDGSCIDFEYACDMSRHCLGRVSIYDSKKILTFFPCAFPDFDLNLKLDKY